MKTRSWMLWVLAVLLTTLGAVYQRVTGPTYAIRGRATIGTSQVSFKLLRTHAGEGDADIRIVAPDADVDGVMEFRRYRSNDTMSERPLERQGDTLVARIPHQPPAGKVMYQILLHKDEAAPVALTEEPVMIRFRGSVPAYAMIPHIVLMMCAMIWSTRAGLEAMAGRPKLLRLAIGTIVLLFFGGLIGGPIVQKFAFGAFWTGWPHGHDLTDNKTAIALVFWLIALWRIRRNSYARAWAIAAALIVLAIFLTPHSLLGSELDYTKLPAQPVLTGN
jgi:hypothetical protein